MIKLTISIFLTAIVGGVGIGMVAQSAGPGDMLYSYKTGVNERISGWFVTEYVANLNHEVDLVEERLSEIDTLVTEGKLTPELAVIARAKVLAQVDTASKAISTAQSVSLTAEQKSQILLTVNRLKDTLIKYQASLTTLDKVANEKKSSRSGGGKGKSIVSIVSDTINDIADSADITVDTDIFDGGDESDSVDYEEIGDTEEGSEGDEVVEEEIVEEDTATRTESHSSSTIEVESETDLIVE